MNVIISNIISLWFLLFLSGSCANSTQDSAKESASLIKVENRNDTLLLKECIPQKDTFIDNSNSVRYVIVDSFYTVKVRVGGIDTVLGYQFNCSVPRGLVPVLHSYSKNMIGLIKGSGQHYREFIIIYVNNRRVIIKNYETALATDMGNNIVVYRNEEDQGKIVVENIKNGNKRMFIVPEKYITEVPRSSISKGKLRLTFSDDSVFSFSLPGKL
jgi:hypothetical protein